MSISGEPPFRRLLAFSGIRSDYDLLSGVYRRLTGRRGMDFGLLIYGAHLSPTYGRSADEVERDGIPIVGRPLTLLDSDTRAARVKSAALLMLSCVDEIERYRPDAILYAGDREDALVAATAAAYLGIPGLHFFGGDHASDGNVDNAVRHAVSKLSSAHFVSAAVHRDRLVSLGEDPERIFLVGSPSLDKFVNTPRLERADVFGLLGIPVPERFAVVIHHPIIVDESAACAEMQAILEALIEAKITALVGFPNIDGGNRAVLDVIKKYSSRPGIHVFGNASRLVFVNLMRHASLMMGNSSAGIIEAPLVPLAAINVGVRQRGRLHGDNVVFADGSAASLREAITTVLGRPFQERLETTESPYGRGQSEEEIVRILERIELGTLKFKNRDPLAAARAEQP